MKNNIYKFLLGIKHNDSSYFEDRDINTIEMIKDIRGFYYEGEIIPQVNGSVFLKKPELLPDGDRFIKFVKDELNL